MSRVQTINRVLALTPEQLNQETPTADNGEQAFTANLGPPTALADAHVFPIVRGVEKTTPPTVPPFECSIALSLKVRFTAEAGDGAATVVVHAFDPDGNGGNGAFYETAEMTVVAVATSVAGGALYVRTPKGTTHVGFEIKGLGDGDTIKVMAKPDNE